jgi:hypothetical protein
MIGTARDSRQARRMMLIVASVQFALSTGHFITLLVVLVRIYIDEPLQQGFSGATPEHALLEAFNITNVSLASLTSKILTQVF